MNVPTTLLSMLVLGGVWVSPHVAFGQRGPDGSASNAQPASPLQGGRPTTERAVEAFNAGEFPKAVRLFQLAYAEDPQSNLLFNIGRVYEEMGELSTALEFYERFVKAPQVSLEVRASASERIRVITEILGQSVDRAEPAEPPAIEDGTSVDTGKPRGRSRPTKLAIVGYSLLGVGGAALIGSGVAGLLAQQDNLSLTENQQLDDPTDIQKRGRLRAWVGDGLLLGGTAVAIAGASIVIVEAVRRKRKRSSEVVTWAPQLGRRQVGLSLSQRF